MTRKIFFTAIYFFLLNSTASVAQTWRTDGNLVSNNATFGTINSKQINFISNNISRGALTIDGRWAFGTIGPPALSLVHIGSPSGYTKDLFEVIDKSGKLSLIAGLHRKSWHRCEIAKCEATAQIVITDNTGKPLKHIIVSGAGKNVLKINAAILSSGAYSYSFILDGKLISTKQMLLVK